MQVTLRYHYCRAAEPWLHSGITWELQKAMMSGTLIWLVWGADRTLEFLQDPEEMLTCSQVWDPLSVAGLYMPGIILTVTYVCALSHSGLVTNNSQSGVPEPLHQHPWGTCWMCDSLVLLNQTLGVRQQSFGESSFIENNRPNSKEWISNCGVWGISKLC